MKLVVDGARTLANSGVGIEVSEDITACKSIAESKG